MGFGTGLCFCYVVLVLKQGVTGSPPRQRVFNGNMAPDLLTPDIVPPDLGDGMSSYVGHGTHKSKMVGGIGHVYSDTFYQHTSVSEGKVLDEDDSPKEISSPRAMPVDLRHVSWSSQSKILVERCKGGLIEDDSEVTWSGGKCISCSCKSSAVYCERTQCPKLECKSQVLVEGKCCPQCPEKLCEASDGRRFKHGADWHMDDCTYCECRKGKVLCSVEDCQIPHCEKPVKVPGQCCPVCLDTSCHASNGSGISAGEVWKEGICTHCYCAGGERKCAEEKCPFINCTDVYRPKGKCCQRCRTGAVDCEPSDWATWSECPLQECGGGMRRRYRSVLIAHTNGGSFCPHMSEAQLCPRLPCDVLPVCPVTEWTSWSHCTATCGNGRRMRSRARAPTTKATMTSLIDCSQTHMQETTHCYAGACIDAEETLGYFDKMTLYDDICYDVAWTEWAECSSDCGIGVQRRHQVLINGSQSRGHLCHLLDETRKCHRHKCSGNQNSVVRCKVTHWGLWTSCSAPCGMSGRRTRYRKVLRQPANGGRPCPKLFVTKACKAKPCQEEEEFASGKCISEDGRRVYSEGEHWLPTPCTSCRCSNSRKQCETIQCPQTDCQHPIRIPGLCCDFCTD